MVQFQLFNVDINFFQEIILDFLKLLQGLNVDSLKILFSRTNLRIFLDNFIDF